TRATSYTDFGVDVPSWRDSRQEQSFTLAPGSHQLLTSSGVSIPFTVTATGSIAYDPAYESVFSGRHGKKLTVRGLPFSIDAAATSYETYTVTGVVPDAIARTQSPVLHLLPGPHFLAIPGVGVSNQFSITPAGRIDYEPVYDKTFAGRGSTTLTVNG